jgi:hypothetical protein
VTDEAKGRANDLGGLLRVDFAWPFRCGQRGGIGVKDPEIMKELLFLGLWTGGGRDA